jgi:hypothetical protein
VVAFSYIILTLAILVLVISAGFQSVGSQATRSSQTTSTFNGFDLVDNSGNIRKPADVRDLYQFLGTYTPTGSSGDTEMHVTYASPGTAPYYRTHGKFADGTVLVKETFATEHAQMTTGDARWASKTIVWFVMIKADKNPSPNNPSGGMDGDGRCSKPMRPISRSQPATKKTAWAVMFPLSQPTGYTYKVTQSSNQSKYNTLLRTRF